MPSKLDLPAGSKLVEKAEATTRCGEDLYLLVSGLRDGCHVKQLSGVILNAAEHHHGDGVALLLNGFQDVCGPQGFFSLKEAEALSSDLLLYVENPFM